MATTRNMPRPSPKKPSSQGKQGLFALLFQSLSAGALAVFLALMVVLVLVGIYSYIVWPWTHWNLEGVDIERLRPWWHLALWSIFGTGTLVGFWCFSGMAFKVKPVQGRSNTTLPPR